MELNKFFLKIEIFIELIKIKTFMRDFTAVYTENHVKSTQTADESLL